MDVTTHKDQTHTHWSTDAQDVWVTHSLKATPEMTPEWHRWETAWHTLECVSLFICGFACVFMCWILWVVGRLRLSLWTPSDYSRSNANECPVRHRLIKLWFAGVITEWKSAADNEILKLKFESPDTGNNPLLILTTTVAENMKAVLLVNWKELRWHTWLSCRSRLWFTVYYWQKGGKEIFWLLAHLSCQYSVKKLKITQLQWAKKNVSLFWRIRKSGESRISSPWRYHLTCRGGPPRTLHSRTTTWPSDAWASCNSCAEKVRERQWEQGVSEWVKNDKEMRRDWTR